MTQFLEKYTFHFIERVVCERESETEQNCNILTPTLLALTAFLSRSPGLLNRGPVAQSLWVLVFSTASCLQLVWSPTLNQGPEGSLCWVLAFSTASCLQMVWSPNWLIEVLSAPSAGCWVLAFSTASCLQMVWSPNWLIEVLRAPSAGCWLSLPHLVSKWSGLQTD